MAAYNHGTWPANQSQHLQFLDGNNSRAFSSMILFIYRLGKCIRLEDDPKEFLINAEIVQVVLSILGFLGAVTSVAVTSSKKLRSSTSLYLTALGAYDALFTLVALISASLKLSGSSVPWLYSVCSCLWTFCVFTSAYVIICVTAERTLSVAWPYFMEKYRSSRLAIKLNIIIFVVGFLTIIPQILDEILNLSIVGNCERGPNDIQLTKFGLIYTFYIRVPVNFVIPFIIVFFMNVWFVCTLIVIRRARRKHEIVHLGFSRDGNTLDNGENGNGKTESIAKTKGE